MRSNNASIAYSLYTLFKQSETEFNLDESNNYKIKCYEELTDASVLRENEFSSHRVHFHYRRIHTEKSIAKR